MDLSVSIVSYRTPQPLERCLRALEAELDNLDLDVTVVDNASGDGSPEMVEREFPWITVMRNARNVGFGAAHNQVLRNASGRYWLVLNSDAVPGPDALKTLVGFMDANPGAAVAGPKLLNADGSVPRGGTTPFETTRTPARLVTRPPWAAITAGSALAGTARHTMSWASRLRSAARITRMLSGSGTPGR